MTDLLKPLKERLLKNRTILRWYLLHGNLARNRRYPRKQLPLIYKVEDLREDYYRRIRDMGDQELEHQIGRLTNWRRIIPLTATIPGDYIEFGTWRGFSLLWISYFMERAAIFNKKLVGLDSFTGLPYADGVFYRYAFSDTSLKLCHKNIYGSAALYDATKKNIFLEQCLYRDQEKIRRFLAQKQLTKFCFIHIDCDVAQSAKEIFELLRAGDFIAPRAYVLLDDYGHASSLRTTIDHIWEMMRSEWRIEEDSATKLTKNFVFTRK